LVQLNGTNHSALNKQLREGNENGYKIMLYNPSNRVVHFAVTDNRVQVIYEDVKELVNFGKTTDIKLSKNVQNSLGRPYSDCKDIKDYRQVICRKDCFNEVMSEKCECKFPSECGLYKSWSDKCKKTFDQNSSLILTNCNLQCPFECNMINFPFQIVDNELDLGDNYLNYKSKVEKEFNITGISDVEIVNRLTRLAIYFNKLETTEVTQSPNMTITDLVANVGGLLGRIANAITICSRINAS